MRGAAGGEGAAEGEWGIRGVLAPGNNAPTARGFAMAALAGTGLDTDGARAVDWLLWGPARDDDSGESEPGVAVMWRGDGGEWIEAIAIEPPPDWHDPWAWFGGALAVHGDYLVVGAPNAHSGTFQSGAAFVYRLIDTTDAGKSGHHEPGRWEWVATLEPPDPCPGGHFGEVVAIHDEVIAVGAPDVDVHGLNRAGIVCVYELTNWPGELVGPDLLEHPAAAAGDRFGASIALGKQTLAVGAPWVDLATAGPATPGLPSVPIANAGEVICFERTAGGEWLVRSRLQSPSPTSQAWFGAAVAVLEPEGGPTSVAIGEPRAVCPPSAAAGTGSTPDDSRTGAVHLCHTMQRFPGDWWLTHSFAGLPDSHFGATIGADPSGEVLIVGATGLMGAVRAKGQGGDGGGAGGGKALLQLTGGIAIIELVGPAAGERSGRQGTGQLWRHTWIRDAVVPQGWLLGHGAAALDGEALLPLRCDPESTPVSGFVLVAAPGGK